MSEKLLKELNAKQFFYAHPYYEGVERDTEEYIDIESKFSEYDPDRPEEDHIYECNNAAWPGSAIDGAARAILEEQSIKEYIIRFEKEAKKTKEEWLNDALICYASRCYGDTISACNRALMKDINCARAYHGIGLAHTSLQQYEHAIIALTRTLELNPDNTKAYIARGDVYRERMQYNKAQTDYKQALMLNPNIRNVKNTNLKRILLSVTDLVKVLETL